MNNKDFDFSCKTCTKYVVKLFTRHLIWSLASLGTKSRGTREKFTNIYLKHSTKNDISIVIVFY